MFRKKKAVSVAGTFLLQFPAHSCKSKTTVEFMNKALFFANSRYVAAGFSINKSPKT
jgi:hypothetical protein